MQSAERVRLSSVLQLVVSGFGLIFFLTGAAGMFLAGVLAKVSGGLVNSANADALSFFTFGWLSLAISLLLIPSLIYTLASLFGRGGVALRLPGGFRAASVAGLFWPLLLVAGQALAGRPALSWLLLPPVQVLSALIPLWWLVELGRRGLQGGSPQRRWGVLSFGLIVTPLLAIVLEILLLLGVVVLLLVWLNRQPQFLAELNRLAQRLAAAQMNPEATLRILRPYLQQPLVVYGLLAFVAGLIPLMEELFKPLGVWLVASRRITPQEGFVAGLLCGAAFALIETSGALAGPAGGSWLGTITGRAGTGLLHVVTAGLSGWGLALAWSKARYLQLGCIFLGVFALHAAWNTFGVLLSLYEGSAALLGRLHSAAPFVLGALAGTMLFILFGVNRKLSGEGTG